MFENFTSGALIRLLAAVFTALTVLLAGAALSQQKSFKKDQLNNSRVRTAYKEKEASVKKMFSEKAIAYPPDEIFFRAFKKEKNHDYGVVELWARAGKVKEFELIKTWPVCYASGEPGPKRREGDGQVPEGFYKIDVFNPASSYYLSMRISYPNESDKILGVKRNLGGDIYIHGNCASIGCLAMTDSLIKEIYLIAVDTKNKTGRQVNFHIFPLRMDRLGMEELRGISEKNAGLRRFWDNIYEGYKYFEEKHTLPAVTVDKEGKYLFK